MSNYIGLDVSLKTTSICIMTQSGKIMQQMTVPTDPKMIFESIVGQRLPIEKVALECGGTSHWLTKELKALGLPAICIDARKMSAAISIRTNKTDKNDAQEIANALRTGYYKEVYQKQDHIVEKQTLLTARRNLIDQRTQTINCIKGLLRMHGKLDCGSSNNEEKFINRVQNALRGLNEDVRLSINALMTVLKTICSEIERIDQRIEVITESDEDVQLFKTIPGVGAVTALTFKLEVDDPTRFKKSRSVGAYVGMTPRQYSSGESQKLGGISKTGSNELRALLCQSAMCMMYRTKTWSRLKIFGLKIKKKHGHGKAKVALGRKLAVVMHRMWIERKPFEFGSVDQKEIDKLQRVSKRKTKEMVKQERNNEKAVLKF
jgi:transposase